MKMLSKDICIRWIFRLCILQSLSPASISPMSTYLSRTAYAPS